jgi:uncharacterized membrane protein YgcG
MTGRHAVPSRGRRRRTSAGRRAAQSGPRPTTRRRSARRSAAIAGAMVLAIGVLTVTGTGTWSPLPGGVSTSGAAPTCQSDGNLGCTATIPCPTGPCPSVDVAPATALHDGQYAFVQGTNFDPTGTMRVALCATNSSATDPSCLLGNWENESWAPIQVPVTADSSNGNLTKVAFPTFFDPNVPGNGPMPAHDITNNIGPVNGFFCGDAADPCEMIVTAEAGQGNGVGFGPPVCLPGTPASGDCPDPNSPNSVAIPLDFAAQSTGCPASDPTINTDSSYSLEHFLPSAVDATCGGSGGVIALNTADNNDTVVGDFAAGGSAITFVDNPSDISELASLAGHAYAFIPVALSGTVVSFLAGDTVNGLSFPVANFNLTPNMVAGLITSAYQFPGGALELNPKPHIGLADNLIPPLNCAILVGCPAKKKLTELANEQQFNSFQLLNPVAADVIPPKFYGSFLSNVSSGASYQTTDWFCNAPNDNFDVSVNEIGQTNPVNVSVQDPNTASTTFTTPPIGSDIWPPFNPAPPWVFPTCQPFATLPPLSGTESNFSESQSPALQAKALRGYAYNGGTLPYPLNGQPQDPLAGFAVTDSSEAAFYGLNDANLQNAVGNFVSPTTASLEAGAADLTPCPTDLLSCPAGTFAMNYDSTSLSSDANAYPMPDITYALVSTAPQPASQVSAEQSLLDNLVNFSHNSGNQLPAGYAPLPTGMYNAAITAITNDLVAEPSTPASSGGGTGGGTSGSGSPSSGSSGSAGSSGSSGSTGTLGGAGSSTPSGSTSGLPNSSSSSPGSNAAGTPGSTTVIPSQTAPLGTIHLVLDDAARYLLPGMAALALGCLLIGPLLYFWPSLRRRRRRSSPG